MYLNFYGLSKPPFRITPDTKLFFEGSDRGAMLHALSYTIHNGEGIIKVVGEVGSGKTMLCRMLPVRMSKTIEWVYLAHPSLSPEHTLYAIAEELGLRVDRKMDKLDVMNLLHHTLLKKFVKGKRVVIMVEESQGMPIETLEEIRLLSNLETDEHKLLQIVLFGQPELDRNLALPQIRQLRERITHSLYLPPLSKEDTHDYLNFRLRAVGYRGPNLFDKSLTKLISKHALGLTRRINIIADKALLIAYTQGRHTVMASDIKQAVRDCQYPSEPNSFQRLFQGLPKKADDLRLTH